jgi:LacI family transcriptional regulator
MARKEAVLGDHRRSFSAKALAALLEHRIRSGEYPRGEWLPAERALAEEFAVSRALVRNALDELAQRRLLRRAPGCRPMALGAAETADAALWAQRRRVGLWAWNDAGAGDLNMMMILRGVRQALEEAGPSLVIGCPDKRSTEDVLRSEAEFLARMADDPEIAGVILWYLGGSANLPALKALRAAQVPVVFVDRQPPCGFEADYVGIDNARAAREIVGHLIAQGHCKIAHVTLDYPVSTLAERLAGYRAALTDAGLLDRSEQVLVGRYRTSEERDLVCAGFAERLLGHPDQPTALFVVNDEMAMAMIAALRARGVRVPQEMAVAGFDNLQRWSPGVSFLTSVNQPFEQMGVLAASLLLERLKIGTTRAYRRVLLEAPLVARHSTSGTPRRGDR